MRRAAPILAAIGLSMCLSLPPQKVSTASQEPSIGNPSLRSSRLFETGDTNDSDKFFQSAIRAHSPGRDYSQKIEALLKQMTVEEKVGQMTQLTLAMIVNGHDQNIEVDPTKLQKAIGQYGVGSILNVYNQALTPDKWQDIITQIQKAAKKTRLGIPVIYGIDSIMAVMAGVDMSMVPSSYSFADLLIALVKEGAVPQSRIDEAVRRILRVKFELGLFDDPMPNAALKSKIGLAESRQVSLQAAQESMTLPARGAS